MGNSCSSCGASASRGNYCQSCYQRRFPSCYQCQSPIHDGQEKIGNYHKECYSLKTGKCCVCFRAVNRHLGKGIYCTECYDAINPLPLRMNVNYQGAEFKYYSRDDRVLERLEPIVNRLMIADTPR